MRLVPFLIAVAAVSLPPIAFAAEQPEPKQKERRVCRMSEHKTESRIGARRVCRTQAEWDEIAEEARRTRDSIRR